MSIQQVNILPFVIDPKSRNIPIEAELAYVVGVVGDKIKKGGIFKRSKERLTQVSKFYWRVMIDTIQNRIILVDSLGIYGGGTEVQDLSLSNVTAQLRAIQSASTVNAFSENLQEANRMLILSPIKYPIFTQGFTRSTIDIIKNNAYVDNIDTPLILPTFEQTISEDILKRLNEIPDFAEAKDNLDDLSHNWLGEINDRITRTEQEYASKINRLEEDVNRRIAMFKEKMDKTIDFNLEKANKAIYKELSDFESSTLGLTGLINPIQEEARKILNEVPSLETPKFQANMKNFLEKSKNQIDGFNNKAKELEEDRKTLVKNLNGITNQFMKSKEDAINEFETNKNRILAELDDLRMNRDKTISELTEMRDLIKQNTDSLGKKLLAVVENRKDVVNKSTISSGANLPVDVVLSLFLIKFQEKNDTRYFVIPPLCKQKQRSADYPNAEMDSAIIDGKRVADKLAEDIVFNRRLRSSFDALKSTNYLITGEFSGAVKQGADYLLENNLISKKGHKKILELLDDLEF
ncbi:MAG: hypothetical protein FK734_04885 [Asgard group archaeon]|nr:hypothetical protein [Asgard group archaeon]